MSFVIRDATLLTMDPSVGDVVGDLLVRDGVIEAVGRVGEASVDEELDGRGTIVLPGFVLDYVSVVPGGSHPSYSHGYSQRDNDFYVAWDAVSRSRETFARWMKEHVLDA